MRVRSPRVAQPGLVRLYERLCEVGLRASSKGRTGVFQTHNAGSIPAVRSLSLLNRGGSSTVEFEGANLEIRVRFPVAAPYHAGVAQMEEREPPTLDIAGSMPVARS